MSQRKASRKGKETRQISPSGNANATKTSGTKPPNDEHLVDSSDLEDCRDIWMDELNGYMAETKKRQSQVAQYFWTSILASRFGLFVECINLTVSSRSATPSRP
jgi:DNA helicase INO80